MQKKPMIRKLLAVSALAGMCGAMGVHAQSVTQSAPQPTGQNTGATTNMTGKTTHDGTVNNTYGQGTESRTWAIAPVPQGQMQGDRNAVGGSQAGDTVGGTASGRVGGTASGVISSDSVHDMSTPRISSDAVHDQASGGDRGDTMGNRSAAGTTAGYVTGQAGYTANQAGAAPEAYRRDDRSGAAGNRLEPERTDTRAATGQSGAAVAGSNQYGAPATGAAAGQYGASGAGAAASGNAELGKAERQAIVDMAMINMAEVAMAKMALSKTQGPHVRAFAQQMIDDHGKALEDVRALAQAKGVDLPTELDAKHKRMAEKLQKLDGQQFDRAYMQQAGLKAHREALSLLGMHHMQSKDADIKVLSGRMIPTVEQHLKAAQQMPVLGGATSGN